MLDPPNRESAVGTQVRRAARPFREPWLARSCGSPPPRRSAFRTPGLRRREANQAACQWGNSRRTLRAIAVLNLSDRLQRRRDHREFLRKARERDQRWEERRQRAWKEAKSHHRSRSVFRPSVGRFVEAAYELWPLWAVSLLLLLAPSEDQGIGSTAIRSDPSPFLGGREGPSQVTPSQVTPLGISRALIS